MKDKKKVGLVKKIAAGVCALVLVVICMDAVPFYAGENSSECEEWFLQNKDLYLYCENVNLQLPDVCNDYSYYRVYHTDFNGSRFVLYLCNKAYTLCGEITKYENNSVLYSYALFTGGYDAVYSSSDGITWNVGSPVPSFITCNFNSDGSYDYLDSSYNTKLVYSNYDLCGYVSGKLFLNGYSYDSFDKPETYNSSLGYLQDLKRQFLYLEDDAWALVEDTAACKFTFSDTTSSGLNITDGNWSVRHYMQIEIKKFNQRNDGLVDTEIIQTYDTIYMNEYSAADLKVMYLQKDTLLKLHDESGFDGLSWWESNFLGYITYYNDYFQLVRTNEDGSVEYGGYVKLWQDDKNINYSVTLDENFEEDSGGYVDNVVPGTHGSGGTYEDAEHDADENASNSSGSGSELMEQVNDILSTVTAVPEIFARMFSFLPDWCLTFFGISVALAGAVLLWKTFS